MPRRVGDLILYSVDDLHEQLGISKMTIRAYLRDGKLKGRKFGVSWFVTEEALKEYFSLDEAAEVPTSEAKSSISTKEHIASQNPEPEFIEPLHPFTYIVQGINDLVSESAECETTEEVISVLEEQAITSLFQVSTIRKKDGKLIEVLKARDFIEKYS
jgi:excisionase family DNA binding protein